MRQTNINDIFPIQKTSFTPFKFESHGIKSKLNDKFESKILLNLAKQPEKCSEQRNQFGQKKETGSQENEVKMSERGEIMPSSVMSTQTDSMTQIISIDKYKTQSDLPSYSQENKKETAFGFSQLLEKKRTTRDSNDIEGELPVKRRKIEGTSQRSSDKKSHFNGLSLSTLKCIKQVFKQQQKQSLKEEQPSLINFDKIEIPNENPVVHSSFREKYQDLLKDESEVRLPQNFENLMNLQRYLDTTINFLNQSRKAASCTFEQIKKSIQSTYAKQFEMVNFKQILYFAPNFYDHTWERMRNKPDYQLIIEIRIHGGKKSQVLKQVELSQRELEFKTKIQEYMKQNTEAIEIPVADLKPLPKYQRSESIKDFLDKHDLKDIQRSITRQNQAEDENSLKTPQKLQKLQEWSSKTGLSIETLKLIQDKSNLIKKSKDEICKSLTREDTEKNLQQLMKICEMIRSTFTYKGKQTIMLKEVVSSLNDTQRGNFTSNDKLIQQIEEISRRVKGFIEIKNLPSGKFIRCNIKISNSQIETELKSSQ